MLQSPAGLQNVLQCFERGRRAMQLGALCLLAVAGNFRQDGRALLWHWRQHLHCLIFVVLLGVHGHPVVMAMQQMHSVLHCNKKRTSVNSTLIQEC